MTRKGRPEDQATSPRTHEPGGTGKVSDNKPMEEHEELEKPTVRHRTPDRRVPPKR